MSPLLAQTVRIDTSKPSNAINPRESVGAGVDRIPVESHRPRPDESSTPRKAGGQVHKKIFGKKIEERLTLSFLRSTPKRF
jgi:hypothetical protein